MDPNLQFSQTKQLLEKELGLTLLDEASKKTISLSDVKLIAQEIVGEFDSAKTAAEMESFLKKIKEKYPFFNVNFIKFQANANTVREKEVINKLSSYIKKLN